MRPCLLRYTLLGLVLCAGCSARPEENQVQLSGKVLFGDKPLPGGVVSFVSPKGYVNEAIIDADGNYRTLVTAGDLKIKVDNRMLGKKPPLRNEEGRIMEPPKAEGPGTPTVQEIKGKLVSIPPKYYSVDTSGLTYKATGSQTFDIRLE